MAQAVVAGRREAGGGLVLITLDVDEALAASYVTPGQYTQITPTKGPPAYFVLASIPGARTWELLVRNAGDAADALTSSELGSSIEITPAIGTGFSLDSATGRDLVVAVVGSALAVVRPIAASRIASGLAEQTTVYIGLRTVRDIAIAPEVEAWMNAGVHVVLCLSKPEDAADRALLARATRASGYVQQVLALEQRDRPRARGTLVFAAGPPAMFEALRGRVGELEVVTNA